MRHHGDALLHYSAVASAKRLRDERNGLLDVIDEAWEAFGTAGNRGALTLAEQISSLDRELDSVDASATKAESGLAAVTAERDAALAQVAAMRAAIKGFQWSICESEVLRDTSLNATERRIFTDIVGWREKAFSTEAAPPTAQGGEGGDHA